MPEIAPARFVRYTATDLSLLACPPYDIIDEAGRAALEELSPDNYVRLILPREQPGERAADRYVRARYLLDKWVVSGVMKRDSQPSVLLVEQRFEDPVTGDEHVRRGIQALIRLKEFSEGIILPHERTLSGPKADRLDLLRATRAHLSPVFILYPDERNEVLAPLAKTFDKPPSVVAEVGDVKHKVWRITDPNIIESLALRIIDKKGYIADGHHRYETALHYRDLAVKEGRPVADTPLDYILAVLTSMSDPGLVIFPTHRVVHGIDVELDDLLAKARTFFDVSEWTGAPLETDAGRMAAINALADRGEVAGVSFLVLDSTGKAAMMSLKKNAPLEQVPSLPFAPSLRSLDVGILHSVLFEHLLGMSRLSQEKQLNLRYEKGAATAISRVRRGEAKLTFLLNATRMQQVRDVAEAGEVMPQKSTYFYPKLLDGLGLQMLEESAISWHGGARDRA
jgi:uncharacterized protein (DUF1015 family)